MKLPPFEAHPGAPFPCGRVERPSLNRRELLQRAGAGFGMVALSALLGQERLLAAEAPAGPLRPRTGPLPARAKRVIWLFMEGGPSAVDLFDPKTELQKHHGQKPGQSIDVFFGDPGPLMKSPYGFAQHGRSGAWVCEKLPNLARHVDDIAWIRSCYAESPNHGPAMYQMNTGLTRAGFPSAGSWVTYGLGTENRNLPGFVVLQNSRGSKGGPGNWGAGFLPSAYQGVPFRAQGSPILNLERPGGLTAERQRAQLDLAAELNGEHERAHPGEADLLARIQSFELAYGMQAAAQEAVDSSREPEAIRRLYGLDQPVSRPFGEKCLLARRLVERGVRFVQVYCNDEWDAHEDIRANHDPRCAETDAPVAGLLADLKQRGMLEETLVIWGGEFGRMPVSEKGHGRDHNPHGFLVWMAGGGVKGGVSYGQTDEIGWRAAENPVSVHDLHATVLYLLGLEHTQLTYAHNGRRFRLTDVSGEVIRPLLA